MARRYPVDLESLELGSVISAERIAEIAGHSPGTNKHGIAALSIIGEIERYFGDNAIPLLPIQRRGSIVIVGGDEMVEALAERQKRAIRAIGRGVDQSQRVDIGEISEGHKRSLHAVQYVGSRLLLYARQVRKELKAPPNQKPGRGLPGWAGDAGQ